MTVVLRVRIAIDVIPLDVGHHGDLRLQPQKHVIVLVGLDDKWPARPAGPRRGSKSQNWAADNETRLGAGDVEQSGDHGRRGRFAVRSGNTNRRMACHQRRQELLAFDHRTGGGLRRQNLRVISRHRRGDQNQLRAGHVLGSVADHNSCTQLG